MTKVFAWCNGAVLLAISVLCLLAAAPAAQAQTVFCPSSVTTPSDGTVNAGIALTAGHCTNPSVGGVNGGKNVGAFSGAALAGQAVGNLAQSMSNVETATATQSIEGRRATEAATCPPGQSFVDGACRPDAAPPPRSVPVTPAPRVRRVVGTPAPAVGAPAAPALATPVVRPARRILRPAATVASGRPVVEPRPQRRRRVPVEPVLETPPLAGPVLVVNPSHYGAWAQGYGDYEERSGHTTNLLQCCTSVSPAQLNIEATSKTTTEGFLGGLDWTRRDLFYGGDGLILGVMGGYMSSDVKVSTSSVSAVQPSSANPVGAVGNGFGSLRAHLDGPSVGVYATYFNGAWSNDFMVKNDFLSLHESFTDQQAYQVCGCAPATFLPFTTPFSGSGSASLDDLTVSDNLNYKIPINARFWVEPTVGLQYTHSSYSGGATALGLDDGDLVRLQGGSRFGFDTILGATHVTTTLTGLAYDDVLVSGNFIQGGVFGSTSDILNDEGKLRGEGVLAVKLDLGQGRSAFVQGEVRGGEDLFGAGGKGGFRIEW